MIGGSGGVLARQRGQEVRRRRYDAAMRAQRCGGTRLVPPLRVLRVKKTKTIVLLPRDR
jgi:hypothetical protein